MSQLTNAVNRLNITRRFLASVCFFALPLGVLFYFNIDQLSEKMNFARGELVGNRLQRPAIRLLKSLPDFRTTSRPDVDSAITQIEQVDSDLGLKANVAAIKKEWEALQQAASGSKTASDQYEQLVNDVRSLISHIGDSSNLTLDPEMDSYYLSDVTSATTAQTLQRIGSAMGMLEPLLVSGKLTPAARSQAAVYSAMLKESDFDRITSDIDTALKENAKSARGPSPSLKATLEPAVASYKTDVSRLIDLLASIGKGNNVTADNFHQVSARAAQSSTDLMEKSSVELDAILNMRINGFAKYRWKLALGTLLSLGLALLVLGLAIIGITRPLADVVIHVEHVAQGDLSQQLPESYLSRGDEIGTLARAMKNMAAGLCAMIHQISGDVSVLSSAASQMHESSTHMSGESKSASEKAHSVAAAAEEMSSNVVSVAAGMEQTTTSLTNIATATDQMTATIGEIAGNSEKARSITQGATEQAQRITEKIAQLSQAAKEIGKVTETITEISSQTNLLALNATIEAARAGAAGKGFAVVANEIKELAQQTAAATEDIKVRIAGVQSSTAGGVSEIGKVSKVIQEVCEIVNSIAAAIEEQAVATKDIAHNISEASKGVNDANERVAQSSQVSTEIARDISTVDHAASEMSEGSGRIRLGAEEVARVSDQLRETVGRFKV